MASAIVFERSVFELNADEPASLDAFFAIGFGSYAPGPGVGSLRSFCICFRAASAAARLAGPESYAAEREVRVVLYVLRALGGLLKRPGVTGEAGEAFSFAFAFDAFGAGDVTLEGSSGIARGCAPSGTSRSGLERPRSTHAKSFLSLRAATKKFAARSL